MRYQQRHCSAAFFASFPCPSHFKTNSVARPVLGKAHGYQDRRSGNLSVGDYTSK
jgi:hypothetical protein